MNSDRFYSDLPTLQVSLATLLRQPNFFQLVPSDWSVLVTDIRDSTLAVERGQYQDVNLLAASSVIACVNLAKQHGLDIPFVFGGDGATCLVPNSLVDECLRGLSELQFRGETNFNLHLRVGALPVTELQVAKHEIRIAKFHVTTGYEQAILLGQGLIEAERIIKSRPAVPVSQPPTKSSLDLSGLECRWNTIQPPAKAQRILCLIVKSTSSEWQHQIFEHLLNDLDTIFGSYTERHPVRTIHLRLSSKIDKLKHEALAKFSGLYGLHTLSTFMAVLLARLYFKYNLKLAQVRGHVYLTQLVAATDNLKIDGVLKTVVAGTPEQIRVFLDILQRLEEQRKIDFGYHISEASVITCFVQKRNAGHIHFLDGAEGGYTLAGKELKQKLKMTKYQNT